MVNLNSMEKRNTTDAILSREFELCDVNGDVVGPVRVLFWKPELTENDDWLCVYRIDGLCSSSVCQCNVFGIDAIQSLHLAFVLAGARLRQESDAGYREVRRFGRHDVDFPVLC